jgi:hypothetical protein
MLPRPLTPRRRAAGVISLLTAALFTAFSLASVPAGAQSQPPPAASGPSCPVLQLGNPNPGDLLSQGEYVVSGLAFDPAATQGIGVDRVDLFLGNRDTGGLPLGSAVPGSASDANRRAFELTVKLPTTVSGRQDFTAYASSSLSGQAMSVSVPVYLGAAPTPTPHTGSSDATPVPLVETVLSTCSSSTPPQAPQAPGLPAFQPVVGSAVHSAPVLDLANPAAGAILSAGDTLISGVAYDPAATQGSGVDQIALFLDSRDGGGTPLATVSQSGTTSGRAFQVKAKVPNTASGGHTFVAYVRSSLSGQEASVSVPVYVGAEPTATPRPHQ